MDYPWVGWVADVFISYSRRDSLFVERLAAAVEGRGKAVWLDTEGIEAGEVFPIALRRAIEGSDAFVFVITPDSVASQFCEQEIEHAQTLGKRILPVLRSKVPDEGLPAEVRERNWIPFEDDEQFAGSVDRLIAALDKDLDHAQAHTRWLVKALDWEAHGRDKSFLLRGSELVSGEAWLAGVKAGAEPEPTALQREYVYASRTVSTRRQRLVVGVSLVAVVVALALAVFALISRSQARRSAAVAVRSATTAEAQRLGAQALTVTPPDESFLYARESYNLEPSSATRGYLFAAQARSPAALAVVTPVPERIRAMLSSPDRRRQLVGSNLGGGTVLDSGTLSVERRFAAAPGVVSWAGSDALLYRDARSGKLGFLDLKSGRFRPDPRLPPTAYSVSANGRSLYTLPLSGASIGVVDLKSMRLERTLKPPPGFSFFDVEPEQGGIVVAVEAPARNNPAAVRYAVWLHSFTGAPSLVVQGAPGSPPQVPYSVGGGRLALPWIQGVRLIDLSSGKTSVIDRDIGGLSNLGLSPDGRTLVLATLAHSGVTVVSAPSGSPLDTFVGHQSQIHGVTFNPSGSVVYTGGADGRLIAWDLRGTRSLATTTELPASGPPQIESFPDGRYIAATRDGRLAAAVNGDGTVQILRSQAPGLPIAHSLVVAHAGAPGQPFAVGFDRAGDRLAVGTDSGRVLIYATSTWKVEQRLTVPVHSGPPAPTVSVAFSPGGDVVVAGVADGRILRFRVSTGAALAPIIAARPTAADANPLSAVAYSPDGTQIAAAVATSGAGAVTVFDASTGARQYSVRDGYFASAVTFTPDGRTLITGDGEGFGRFWNAATGRADGSPIRVDEGTVNSLAVDSAGVTLASAGTDGATWLFDLKSRTEIGTPLGADPSTTTAALFVGRGDGSPLTLATPNFGSRSATLTRWNLKAGYLAKRACRVARRNLTQLEWEQVLPNLPYAKVCAAYPLAAS